MIGGLATQWDLNQNGAVPVDLQEPGLITGLAQHNISIGQGLGGVYLRLASLEFEN
jgi:hypothetical protein